MKTKFRHKVVAMTLAMMMSVAPVWGSAFAADEFAGEQPNKPVAESYKDNDKIEDYNKKVDDYNKSAEEYNKSVDEEYEAAVEETNKKNAEIEAHNAAETERVKTAEENNAKAEAEAKAANEQIDVENAAEEARVNEHNSNEDAKVKASEEAKKAAEEENEAITAHNEAVAKYAEDKVKYDADYAQYEKDLTMEQKIKAAGYASVEQYNERINKAYNEPAKKAVEKNAVTEIENVNQTYKIKEASEKSGVNVSVNVRHVFEGTDVSYSDSFTIDANDTITLNSIAALGSATQPGYASFYYKTDEDHSMGYWCESWSQLETTARHCEYGWNCGDEHEISYSEGKSHANDEEVIDMTYYYFWVPLRTAKTYNTPVAPTELVNPGEAKELVKVPGLYTPNYINFVKKEYVKANTEEIAAANFLEKIESPVKKAYIGLLDHMALFAVPEPAAPAAPEAAPAETEKADEQPAPAAATPKKVVAPKKAASATATQTVAAAQVAAPAQEAETELIAEQEVPMAEKTEASSPVMIEDNSTPLADGSSWALINLIMTIVTGLISAVLLAGIFGKNEDEDEEGNEVGIKRNRLARLMSLVPAIGAAIIFIITEDMSNPMVLTDGWTLLMAAILLIQAVVAFIAKKSEDESDDEEMTETMNA